MEEQHKMDSIKEEKADIRHYLERRSDLLRIIYDEVEGTLKFNSRLRSEAFVELLWFEQVRAERNLNSLLESGDVWVSYHHIIMELISKMQSYQI